MEKEIYVLGINESHVASAALLKNGEIIACASEERFTRKKGQWGYPEKAIDYCLTEAGIAHDRVNKVVLGFNNLALFIHGGSLARKSFFGQLEKSIRPFLRKGFMILIGSIPLFYKIYNLFFKTLYSWTIWFFLERQHKSFLLKIFKKKSEDVYSIDHHLAHAMGAYYSSPLSSTNRENDVLIISNDGMGDDVCSRIYTVHNNQWREIASTPNSASLGWLYLYVTEYLGMKPNEHEYKVMGLAPYAHKSSAQDIAAILRKIMWVSGLHVVSKIPSLAYYTFIEKNFTKKRFDAIAGGIQLFTEEILLTLVKNAIAETNINNVVVGGGIFMNVKANMRINTMREIKNFFVMPSCGDESTAIGAAYYGYRDICIRKAVPFDPKPLNSLYLGPAYGDKDIKVAIRQFKQNYSNLSITALLDNKAYVIANLLAQDKIIARFDGRMEFGARALGNRSILANPSDQKTVRTINDQIKGRDFWMPFAPVILKEYADEYLVSPRDLNSPFMMLSFQTTLKAQKELIAALHPYDYTARPQILERKMNPEYYDIVNEFRKITGIGALLNTSFNIHGEPIVCTPSDALRTFRHSKLEYLLLGNYLLHKKE